METIFIVNINENSFFRYTKKNETDLGYKKIVLELLTPPHEKTKDSHWLRTDKIVFAPQKKEIYHYLERYYNELYL